MVTNYAQVLTATADDAGAVPSRLSDGLMHLVGNMGRVLCGVRGHDSLLHFERNRMMLRCMSCGHDTPGWEISGRPRQRFDGDSRRHRIPTQLVVLRKTA